MQFKFNAKGLAWNCIQCKACININVYRFPHGYLKMLSSQRGTLSEVGVHVFFSSLWVAGSNSAGCYSRDRKNVSSPCFYFLTSLWSSTTLSSVSMVLRMPMAVTALSSPPSSSGPVWITLLKVMAWERGIKHECLLPRWFTTALCANYCNPIKPGVGKLF